MKIGDMVYVNWPTGKDGPYRVGGFDINQITVFLNDVSVLVPRSWCESVEPELEDERLYYYHFIDPAFKEVKRGKYIPENATENAEPVHRRWNELSEEEKDEFLYAVRRWEENDLSLNSVFVEIYKLITGEDHP